MLQDTEKEKIGCIGVTPPRGDLGIRRGVEWSGVEWSGVGWVPGCQYSIYQPQWVIPYFAVVVVCPSNKYL